MTGAAPPPSDSPQGRTWGSASSGDGEAEYADLGLRNPDWLGEPGLGGTTEHNYPLGFKAASAVDSQLPEAQRSAPAGDVGAIHTLTGLDGPPETHFHGATDYYGNVGSADHVGIYTAGAHAPVGPASGVGPARTTPFDTSWESPTRNGTRCRLQAAARTVHPTEAPSSKSGCGRRARRS